MSQTRPKKEGTPSSVDVTTPLPSWWQTTKGKLTFNRRVKTKQIDTPEEWISFKIGYWAPRALCVLSIGFIATIIVLIILTKLNNGFLHIARSSVSFFKIEWELSLTWIFLPSLIFQIYGLCVAAVIDAFGFRQPFVELARGGIASKTIDLDYQSFFPIQRECKAFKNGHSHLGVAFLLSLLIKTSLGPLGARLIDLKSGSQEVKLTQSYALATTVENLNAPGWDLGSILSAASSTKIYGESYPRWVDGNRTYLNFSLPTTLSVGDIQQNVSVPTTAYFSKLDCQVVDNLHEDVIKNDNNPDHLGRMLLNGSDHDCPWNSNFAISPDRQIYSHTESKTACGPYGDSVNTGRLIVVAGYIESTELFNLTGISCVPTYWTSSGRLVMSLNQNARNPIISWTEDEKSARELRPGWWASFEDQLQDNIEINIGIDTSLVSGTKFGQLIYDYLQTLPNDHMGGDALITAAQTLYADIYALLLDRYMIRPTSDIRYIEGELTVPESKLFIAYIFAGIILGIFVGAVAVLIMIIRYTEKHRSILSEEPVGLLGYSGLLANSALYALTTELRDRATYVGRTRADLMTIVESDNGNKAEFQVAERTNPRRARIQMDGRDLTAEDIKEILKVYIDDRTETVQADNIPSSDTPSDSSRDHVSSEAEQVSNGEDCVPDRSSNEDHILPGTEEGPINTSESIPATNSPKPDGEHPAVENQDAAT